MESRAEVEQRRVRAALIALTIVALALRLFRLGQQSLWNDELVSWASADGSLRWVVTQTQETSNIPPVYYLIAHAFLGLANTLGKEVALRLPSALSGAATIPVFHAVARRMIGARAAMVAAIWLCIAPFHVWYSQEARPYATLLFFATAAILCVLRGLEEPERSRFPIGFGVFSALAFGCHVIALPLVLAAGWILLVELRAKQAIAAQWRRWAMGYLVFAILCVPLVIRLRQMGTGAPPAGEGRDPFSLVQTAYAFSTFVDGFSIGPSLAELHEPDRLQRALHAAPLLAPSWALIAVALLFAVVSLWRTRRESCLELLGWLAAPFAFVALGAILSANPFNARYVILAGIPLWLLLFAGLEAARPRGLRWILYAVLAATTLVSLRNHYFDERYAKEDYRAAAASLRSAPPARVLMYRPFTARDLRFYDPGRAVLPFPIAPAPRDAAELRARLEQVTAQDNEVWLLLNRGTQAEYASMRAAFESRFTPIETRRFAGIELVDYRRK